VKILFLGGTQFVGLHMVEAALARGHEVTLFNRGNTNPDLFPEVEKLRGDRDGGLAALKGRKWDAVIDVNGYVPRIVKASAELLAAAVDRYIFISTLAVYSDWETPDQDESAPLAQLVDETVEQITGETYGGLKVLCEQAAEAALPGRVLNIRPGYIVGPHDHTDRLTYWLRRIDQGGEMLAPGDPANRVQMVDGRDLAAWTILMTERRETGAYNMTGPDYPLTWGKLFETAKVTRGSDVTLTWVSEAFLNEQGVGRNDLPLWAPIARAASGTRKVDKAIAAGLTYRPLAETINDTLVWDAAYGSPSAGLKPERELELLNAWHAQN
jgi:2'-hydroxyisoflavone reductase